jgi:hypothetical protein
LVNGGEISSIQELPIKYILYPFLLWAPVAPPPLKKEFKVHPEKEKLGSVKESKVGW